MRVGVPGRASLSLPEILAQVKRVFLPCPLLQNALPLEESPREFNRVCNNKGRARLALEVLDMVQEYTGIPVRGCRYPFSVAQPGNSLHDLPV